MRDSFIEYKGFEIHTTYYLDIDLWGNVYYNNVLIGIVDPVTYTSGSLPDGYYYKNT